MQTGSGIDVAFAVVVLASYLATFASIQEVNLPRILSLIILGIIYVNVGIYGYAYAAKKDHLWVRLAYFLVQIPTGCLIIYLGGGVGYNALVLLPLAGHSVLLLEGFWVYLLNIVIGIAFLVPSALLGQGWGATWSNLLTFLAGQVFIIVFTQMAMDELRSRKEVERLVKELQSANEQLRQYALQVEELAITKERNRVAREIHDGLGHYMTTIHMQIQAGRAISESNPWRADELFAKAQNLAQEALIDIRQSVASLRSSPSNDLPLVEILQKVLDGCSSLGLTPELVVEGTLREVPPSVRLTLFRAVQEGVNNTCKHADALHIWVRLSFQDPDTVELTIKDDGKGAIKAEGGFGLIGLRERVNQLRGEMQIRTEENQGFELIIRLPVKYDQNSNR